MSHTSTIKSIVISSVTALRAAVEELARTGTACRLIEKAKPRAYFENQQGMGLADYVLQLDGASYDVGFYKQENNTYEPRTDFWGGSVERVLGTPCPANASAEVAERHKLGKLLQLYGVHVTMEQARRKGLACRRITGKDGVIKLELTGANL